MFMYKKDSAPIKNPETQANKKLNINFEKPIKKYVEEGEQEKDGSVYSIFMVNH